MMTPCRHYCSGSNKQGRGSHVVSMVDTLQYSLCELIPGGFGQVEFSSRSMGNWYERGKHAL